MLTSVSSCVSHMFLKSAVINVWYLLFSSRREDKHPKLDPVHNINLNNNNQIFSGEHLKILSEVRREPRLRNLNYGLKHLFSSVGKFMACCTVGLTKKYPKTNQI